MEFRKTKDTIELIKVILSAIAFAMMLYIVCFFPALALHNMLEYFTNKTYERKHKIEYEQMLEKHKEEETNAFVYKGWSNGQGVSTNVKELLIDNRID